MIVIHHLSIYGDIEWIEPVGKQIREAVGSAYTEKAFQMQLDIWQEQLEEIPYAKEHGVYIGEDELSKRKDVYTIYEPDEKGRRNIIGDILLYKVDNIKVTNGKGIVSYADSATTALNTFAALSRTRIGDVRGYDPDDFRAQANAMLLRIYKQHEDKKGKLNLNQASTFIAMMVFDHYLHLVTAGLNAEAEEFLKVMRAETDKQQTKGE